MPVNGKVQPHELGELGVVVAQHSDEVRGPVEVGIDRTDPLSFTVRVTVDGGGDDGQFGDQVH